MQIPAASVPLGLPFPGDTPVTTWNPGSWAAVLLLGCRLQIWLCRHCSGFVGPPAPSSPACRRRFTSQGRGFTSQERGFTEDPLREAGKEPAGFTGSHRAAKPRNQRVTSSWVWPGRTRRDTFAYRKGRSETGGLRARSLSHGWKGHWFCHPTIGLL